MLQYDLSQTDLACRDELLRVPTEGELFAITLGLLLYEDRAFHELTDHAVTLTSENHERVAQLIELNASPFLRDFGSERQLRRRLFELVGLQISRTQG